MEANIIKFEPHKEIHILVVDGDPVSCKLLEETLLTCKYRVTVAEDAKKALKLILTKGKNKFDIAMIDVHQSETDGFHFIEMAINMEIFIIHISATRDDVLMAEARSHGADLFILKPVGLDTATFLWQHLLPRYIDKKYHIEDHERKKSDKISSPKESCSEKETLIEGGDDDNKKVGNNKKRRISWNAGDLNDKFLIAVNTLGGIDSKYSTPKKIQELMNAGDEVTRSQIASHLQKHKEKAKKGRGTVNQQEGNLTNQNPRDATLSISDNIDLPNHVSDDGFATTPFDLPSLDDDELMSFKFDGINQPNSSRIQIFMGQFQDTDSQSNFPDVGFQHVSPNMYPYDEMGEQLGIPETQLHQHASLNGMLNYPNSFIPYIPPIEENFTSSSTFPSLPHLGDNFDL